MGQCLCLSSKATPAQIKEFLKNVRPFDLLVFQGGEFVSDTIRKAEKLETGNGEISHVEVAITREWCTRIKPIVTKTDVEDNNQTLFSWGSTLSGKLNDGAYNAETGGVNFGVQVRVLEDIIDGYLVYPKANIGVCRLIDNPIEMRKDESPVEYARRAHKFKALVNDAYDKYQGSPYNGNPLALVGSLFPKLRPLRNASEEVIKLFTDVNKWVFCSQWAAVLYIHVGIIDDSTDGVIDGKTLDPRDVVPTDFLGTDTDKGIVKPICQLPPLWLKKSN